MFYTYVTGRGNSQVRLPKLVYITKIRFIVQYRVAGKNPQPTHTKLYYNRTIVHITVHNTYGGVCSPESQLPTTFCTQPALRSPNLFSQPNLSTPNCRNTSLYTWAEPAHKMCVLPSETAQVFTPFSQERRAKLLVQMTPTYAIFICLLQCI